MTSLDAPSPFFPPPSLDRIARHTQTILAWPYLHEQGVYGNCLQYAIASLLGVNPDAVPHFAQFTWWEPAFTLWCRGHDLDPTWIRRPEDIPASGPTLLMGKSPRGWAHVCVGDGPTVIWDPHPSRDGLTEVTEAAIVGKWTHTDRTCWLCHRGCQCERQVPNVA